MTWPTIPMHPCPVPKRALLPNGPYDCFCVANHPRVTPCPPPAAPWLLWVHSPKSPFPVTTTVSGASILRVLPSRPRADAGGPFVAPDNRLLEHCRRSEPWEILSGMDADLALLHEASATRQLDSVFVSQGLADSVRVRACNDPDEWGPSDHCRLVIEVA